MNQRAVELFEQALQFAYTEIGKEQANTAYFQGAVAGKLAELIVKECANKILEWKSEPFPLDPDFAAKIIKEHFGVEE